MRLALIWLQRLVDVPFGADKVEFQKMVRSSDGSKKESGPEGAKMIPDEIVRLLEGGVYTARTGVLRIFCGLGCKFCFVG